MNTIEVVELPSDWRNTTVKTDADGISLN